MYNELFKIGPVTIYGYGLMIALGVLLAYRLVDYRATNRQFEFPLGAWWADLLEQNYCIG